MCQNVTLKSQDNLSFIEFQKKSYDDTFVYFKLIVNNGIFSAKATGDAEISDFKLLKDDLNKMYNYKLKECSFTPLENLIYIKFSLQETGAIDINFELTEMDVGVLSSEFRTDLTFLPYLIREIDEFLCD